MYPAASIIVFTVLSGAGFGMMIWLGLGLRPDQPAFGLIACALSFLLACSGLLASLWHLGNPQRAWRALSQWRSSWLSREGVFSIATLGIFGLYSLFWVAGVGRIAWLGIVASALAAATIYSTSMIYASIKAVPRWSKTPTALLFLGHALAGGMLAVSAVQAVIDPAMTFNAAISIIALSAAACISFWWNAKAVRTALDADGSTPETAIGLTNLGRARLLEAPHTSQNYLMKEMVFQVGRKHASILKSLAFLGAFIMPVLIALLSLAVPALSVLMLIALPVHLLGVAASRWLFFAQAQHLVSLYYGHR